MSFLPARLQWPDLRLAPGLSFPTVLVASLAAGRCGADSNNDLALPQTGLPRTSATSPAEPPESKGRKQKADGSRGTLGRGERSLRRSAVPGPLTGGGRARIPQSLGGESRVHTFWVPSAANGAPVTGAGPGGVRPVRLCRRLDGRDQRGRGATPAGQQPCPFPGH